MVASETAVDALFFEVGRFHVAAKIAAINLGHLTLAADDAAGPSTFHKLCNGRNSADEIGMVPMIWLCQNLFTDRSNQQVHQRLAYCAWGCFRHFWFWGLSAPRQPKAPPFGGAFLLSLSSGGELAIPLGIGGLARILLLLARLLAAALLLAGLLPRGLVLLARVLVLVRHSGSPLLNVTQR